ncbi:hypothetical protein [Proteiniclasticum ruminis]|uniref:Uncharacterized protein n=1 Tax=Proteiniclasticum ruminis TaxID=398199 RepID=A0A1G8SQN7_9CLOT|nr:hypothetical protein [Proteiniclasticum ruminis]MBP9920714.1 hypothetical protein [Proteiniclasticum sp.]SDJ31542.1 hypothetical protein SAMN05421804_11346 [Proteiniclasticum ruminis]
MSRVVFYHKKFKVLQIGKSSYVVVRKNTTNYSQHSHLSSLNGAIRLVKLLEEGKLPHSDYLRESARRLLKEQEYTKLKSIPS